MISKPFQKETIAGLDFEFMLAPDTEAPAEMFFYIPRAQSPVHRRGRGPYPAITSASLRGARFAAPQLGVVPERGQ